MSECIRRRWITRTGLAFVLGAAIVPGSWIGNRAMAQATSKICGLLPMADLESHYGAKSGPATGMDGEGMSICTVNIGKQVVKVQSAPPGTPGLPTSLQVALGSVTMMLGSTKGVENLGTKDFGKVGCATMKATGAGLGIGPKDQPPVYTTTCFVVDGGYLSLALTDSSPERVSFESVKKLTEKAAAARK
jgi:hypothetical protein